MFKNFIENKYMKKIFGFIALTSFSFLFMTLVTLKVNEQRNITEFVWENLKIAIFIGFNLVFITPYISKIVENWVLKNRSKEE